MASTTKKAAPVKKAAAKKTAPPPAPAEIKRAKAEREDGMITDIHLEDMDIEDDVVALRDTDPPIKWDEIAVRLGVSSGKAILAYMKATLSPKEKVKGSYTDRCKAIPGLRDDEAMSWGQISVRVDMPESHARGVYESLTNKSTRGNRVGRGGRYPKEEDPTPRKAGTPRKAAAAKAAAPAKAKVEATGKKSFTEMNLAELQERLNGAVMKVKRSDGREQNLSVKEITGLKKGEITFTDGKTGGVRTVMAEAIVNAGKPKAVKAA